MKLKALIILSGIFLIFGTSYAQKLTVTPKNGVLLSDNSRATYSGKNLIYDVLFEASDTISSIKIDVNGTEITTGTTGVKTWSVSDYNILTIFGTTEHKFTVTYATKSDNSQKTETSSVSLTVYESPVKPDKTIDIEGDSAAIGSGTFAFKSVGANTVTGDPKGWTYTWEMTDQVSQTGDNATWTVSNAKNYTVTLKAKNTINNSTETEYASEEFTLDTKTVIVYPKISVSSINRKNVIKGDKMNVTVKFDGGQSGKWQNVKITVNEDDVTPTVSATEASFVYTTDSNTQTYTITVDAENKPDGMSSATKIAEYNSLISAWDKPTSDAPTSSATVELRGNTDPDYVMKLNPYGGCLATDASCGKCGWEYVWSKDSKDFSNPHESYTISSATTENIDSKYNVTAINYVDGIECYRASYFWNVVLWAAPSAPTIEDGTEAYYGRNTVLSPTTQGGYTEQSATTGWKFEWYENGKSLGIQDSLKTKTFDAKAGVDSYEDTSYKLIATNYWKDGTPWKTFEVPITITIYSLPGVQLISNPGNIYYNDDIMITFTEIGGIPKKWRRTIKYTNSADGSEKISYPTDNNDGTFTINLSHYLITGGDDKRKTITFYETSINGYGKNQMTYDTQTWTVDIWPKAQFAESLETAPVGVREGDDFLVSVANPSGGYNPDGRTRVSYMFNYPGEASVTQAERTFAFTTTETTGYEMNHSSKSYVCTANILGPNGEIWDTKEYTNDIEVYRHPQIPNSVVLKGNGTSGTYIVNMPDGYDNDMLAKNKYNYTYISTGGTVYENSEYRYAVLGSIEPSSLCVATYWNYDDGSTVYSDFRNYDGTVSVCAWSTFKDNSGPRSRATDGEASGIDDVTSEVCNATHIYDLNGQLVINPVKGKLYIRNHKKFICK